MLYRVHILNGQSQDVYFFLQLKCSKRVKFKHNWKSVMKKWSSQILTKFILHTEKQIYTAGKINLKTHERKTDTDSFLMGGGGGTTYKDNFINKASKLYPNLNKYQKL